MASRSVFSHRRRLVQVLPRFACQLDRFYATGSPSFCFLASRAFTGSRNRSQEHRPHHHSHPPLNRKDIRGEFGSYQTEYDRSINDPEGFWKDAAKALTWFEEPKTIVKQRYENNPYFFDWFPDGKLNVCYNCLDVHVKNGRGDQTALIYDSPLAGNKKEQYTYKNLLAHVQKLAGALKNDLGVEPGDRVVLYMPLIPQAIAAMLACARIGAVHSVVFGGFAAQELASRIDDSTPKVVITASCGIEPKKLVPYRPILEKALELSTHRVEKVVVVQRPDVQDCELGSLDVDYNDLISTASQPADALALPATHPGYVLYTSGTTGNPKGVVRDTGGHAVALRYSMSNFYGMRPGDVFFTASDIGWVVGHSYIVYGPLLHGCTTILYEGKPAGTPDSGAFWRIIEDYGVKALFTAPTALRIIRQTDPHADLVKKYDVSSLRFLFVAGEHFDASTMEHFEEALPHASVIDHYWQTELGWPAVGNSVGLGIIPTRYSSCGLPVCGYDIQVVDSHGKTLPANTLGSVVMKMPLPPCALKTVYGDDERMIRYLEEYPGWYETGDAGFKDSDGYIYMMGRTDDVINTAGHRLSTGTMEEILLEHSSVADCAVVKVKDSVKGEVPFAFVVLDKNASTDEEELCKDLVDLVRSQLGPVAAFKNVRVVKGLPKTRSGKILRGTMSKIANGEPYNVTPTIEDATVFDHLAPIIQESVRQKKI